MKITPNIGILNALIRITCGLTMLTWCTAKLVRRPRCNSYLFVAIISAMKVAEGIVRYCPVTDLLKRGQDHQDYQQMIPDPVQPKPSETSQTNDVNKEINVMEEIKNFKENIE